MSHRFYTLDVFTNTRFEGNPLAVFSDANGSKIQAAENQEDGAGEGAGTVAEGFRHIAGANLRFYRHLQPDGATAQSRRAGKNSDEYDRAAAVNRQKRDDGVLLCLER